MDMSGSYLFPLERGRLWAALMDPEVVGACIPGVRGFAAESPGRFAFEVTFRVGIVSGSYKGTLTLLDVDEPNGYRMAVAGAGVRTDVSGEGTVTLTDESGGTRLAFDGAVQVTGMLARVGQRMMGNVAKTQIDRFFACLSEKAT